MFAIRIELCIGNILANFTPLSSRGKGRKRLATQAAEPRRTLFCNFSNLTMRTQKNILTMFAFAAWFASRVPPPPQQKKCAPTLWVRIFLLWRRRRDSNPRTAFDGYTISSRAPSTKLGDSSTCYSAEWVAVGRGGKQDRSLQLSHGDTHRNPTKRIIYYPSPFDKCFPRRKREFLGKARGGAENFSLPFSFP